MSIIKRWSTLGGEGRNAIRQLFGGLVRRRKLDVRICNAILRLCYTAEDQETVRCCLFFFSPACLSFFLFDHGPYY